ncbi:ARM repeat-containing protein [Artomyces pyxidatus]|uniref:ARM repeat-containing protein n=1 Tax=Artomyces pyxidatus TaxID=48021 RepID=A0ACB8SXZ9_9AGAM|nr:ARM repeat-containing protein [Artomyces pyxidatus]
MEDGAQGFVWHRERVTEEWKPALEYASQKLLTSKTSVRVRFLQEELLPLAKHEDLSLSQTLAVFKLLTETYPRYIDSASREAVEAVGVELVRKDESREEKLGVTEQIIGWISNEVGRISKRASSHAATDIFILLSWCCGLYTVSLHTSPQFTSSRSWNLLVSSLASLLDLILDPTTRAKSSMQRSALVRTRRALRSAPEHLRILIRTLLAQSKTSVPPLLAVPLIGVGLDVTVRLKNVKDSSLAVVSDEIKSDVIALYSNNLLMARSLVPPHVTTSLNGFIQITTEDDFKNNILPTMEKALLRSPEYALTVISEFFLSYPFSLDSDVFRRILTPTLNCAKSANATVRLGAIALFRVVLEKKASDESKELAVTELLNLAKAGKSVGPDRQILYSMLGFLSPSTAVSSAMVSTVPALLAKETNDAAIPVLAAALTPHLVFHLKEDIPLSPDVSKILVTEMQNNKPVIRRAFVSMVGSAFWELGGLPSEGSKTFAKAALPAFEASLKAVAANPLNAAAGPVEGYVAAGVLLGPFSRSGTFGSSLTSCFFPPIFLIRISVTLFLEDVISRNATVQSIASSSKPSFLLWDKVYQKLTSAEEEMWLLRAIESASIFYNTELTKNDHLRTQIGLTFLHLSVESQSPEFRRRVIVSLEHLINLLPTQVNTIVREALTSHLLRPRPSTSKVPNGSTEDEKPAVNKQSRYLAFMLASAAFSDDVEIAVRERLLSEFVVLAHHPVVCGHSRQAWIELCQKARADPRALVDHQLDRLFSIVVSTMSESQTSDFSEAVYRAITTLAFVAPDTVLPRVMDQLREDIGSDVNALSESDLGIWATPEGVAYVDVLAKKSTQGQTKGKDAALAKWDAEVRKSLAGKKSSATPTLSKQDQALVNAQLEKEAKVRKHVSQIQMRLARGLEVINHLVAGNVEDFRSYVSPIASLLLSGGALEKGSRLVGQNAFDTYLELSKCCSDRLDTFGKWIGIATLRSLEVASVPEELQSESINQLIIRVLYRLRSLSEQIPLDAATFSYAFPLLHQVLLKGGIGLGEEDDPLEQIALSLDIVKFHCGEFSDLLFPRTQIIRGLLHAMRTQPKLSKEASSALIDLGQAIYQNATKEEIDVLLDSTLVQEAHARNASLQALQPFDLTDLDWSPELLIASNDNDEQNVRLARHIWEDNGLDVPEAYSGILLKFLDHDNAYVRVAVAGAFVDAVDHWPQSISSTVNALYEMYRDKAKILAPEYDQYGMVDERSLDRTDPWHARLAVSQTFQQLAPSFSNEDVVAFFHFLIKDEALGDRSADVRRGMLDAGTAVIDYHGSSHLAELIAMFQTHLAGSQPSSEAADFIQEAVVILFGRVARHLDPSDARLPAIVSRLVEALKTPSEQVQVAVSDCLAPLAKVTRTSVPKLVELLLEELFSAPKYAARRGAAYGLAGIIKGIGITGMKEFNILSRLRTATEDKKQYEPRQGAMFALETFSSTLGRLFEPYAIEALPLLLSSFGDSIPDVREAATDAAKIIMGNMSGYGVKLILPDLLSGLDEKQWRTKKGSIELMGMMAYCAPRQLSQSLPIIIPRLTGVLTDSHAQVRSGANKSLKQFGEVISNPEVQALVPVFLKAMVDPAKTPNALTALLKTSFVHYIDHSSLALVIPILERGLRERSADTKKKAAQIIGNLASLTDSKDFVPYLSGLLPMVHLVLVDPVPEARATAAKTLGTLVERLGEINFPDLVPSLIRTLKTDSSGVDRQGAAQGLSEVLSGLGMERLEGLLPDIIANAQSPRSTVREGFMSLLVFLPATFGTRFQPHLPKIIVPILKGLSDSEEYVREAAMRAGRMIITNYSGRAIDLLLPELERGMFDPGWRIRQSSITLVGELLFKVSGISGKAEIDEDEEGVEVTVAETSRKALTEVLGSERRDRILAALYLARQDTVHVVRQSSIHIWKALVNNTPKTVREILPELINQVMSLLCSSDSEQQETGERTIAELCRKFGERIVGEIVAILRSKATSPDAKTRQGVCLVLSQVMTNSNEAQQEGHEDEIISMVRASLVDDESSVRSAAAQAFDILQEELGAKAIDQTIPTLLEALRQPGQSSGTALQALREVMSVRASTVFPVLIPTLIATPMSVFNARALASLVTVAGSALSKRLTIILSALVKVTETMDPSDEELKTAVDDATEALLSSINDAEGLNTLMLLLLGWMKHEDPKRRVSAANYFSIFCEVTQLDWSLYRVDWVRLLISALDDRVVAVHTAAWNAFDAFVKSIPKDDLESLVVPLRRTVENTGTPGTPVPGFSLPKGVAPFVPIIIAGLTTGSNEQREQAAYAIGDLVERTAEAAIKPYVVPFTGPLIRVATQATTYPPSVKTALLRALTTMLERIPAFVKPFFPQLQRTFVKSASDPASAVVRTKAAQALGVLMKNQPRVDPVVTELITGAKTNDEGIAASLVLALSNVIQSAGPNVGEKAREAAAELVADAFKEIHDDSYIQSTAALFASLSSHPDQVQSIIERYLLAGTPTSALSSHSILALLTLADSDDSGSANILGPFRPVLPSIAKKVQESIGTEKPNIARPAREAKEILRRLDDSLFGS